MSQRQKLPPASGSVAQIRLQRRDRNRVAFGAAVASRKRLTRMVSMDQNFILSWCSSCQTLVIAAWCSIGRNCRRRVKWSKTPVAWCYIKADELTSAVISVPIVFDILTSLWFSLPGIRPSVCSLWMFFRSSDCSAKYTVFHQMNQTISCREPTAGGSVHGLLNTSTMAAVNGFWKEAERHEKSHYKILCLCLETRKQCAKVEKRAKKQFVKHQNTNSLFAKIAWHRLHWICLQKTTRNKRREKNGDSPSSSSS